MPVTTKGRNAMRSLAIVTVVGLCALATDAIAQSWQPPSPNERCPSKWGAADERGSGNHMKPANVLRAAQLMSRPASYGSSADVAHRHISLIGNQNHAAEAAAAATLSFA
jgi:hypothetical protein